MNIIEKVKALMSTNGCYKQENAYKGLTLEFNRFDGGSMYLFFRGENKSVKFCVGISPDERVHLGMEEKDPLFLKLWNFFARLYTDGVDLSRKYNVRKNGKVVKKCFPSNREFVGKMHYCWERRGRGV